MSGKDTQPPRHRARLLSLAHGLFEHGPAADGEATATLAADPATNRAILRTGTGDEVAVVLSNPASGAVLPLNLKPNDSGHVYVV